MQIRGVLLCCLGALLSCRRGETGRGEADASARSDALDHEALRDDGRLILERHCGLCHVRDYPTALPGALAEKRGSLRSRSSSLAALAPGAQGAFIMEPVSRKNVTAGDWTVQVLVGSSLTWNGVFNPQIFTYQASN